MKTILKTIRSVYRFVVGYVLGVIFYPKVIRHCDYRKYDDPGWNRIRKSWFRQKIIGVNRKAIWPTSDQSLIGEPANLVIDETSERCLMVRGLYLQCMDAKTIIGRNVYIAPNVGIITSNHDVNDPSRHLPGKDVIIGDGVWIGMNAVILPGVVLGPGTVVGAGAIVTKSFEEGNCVIAGNPARLLRKIGEESVER